MKIRHIIGFVLFGCISIHFLHAGNNIESWPLSDDVDGITVFECDDARYMTIENIHFELLVKKLIKNALKNGRLRNVSNGLLKCYEQIGHHNNTFKLEDLQDALPDLIFGLKLISLKAPRPNMSDSNNALVGPLPCDLSEVERLIKKISSLLFSCCSQNEVSFEATFTLIEDIKNTIIECCANITNEFNGTFTVINHFFSGLYPDLTLEFNGTFTVLTNLETRNNSLVNAINNCCNSLTTQLNNCCTQLIATSSALYNNFQTNVYDVLVRLDPYIDASNCIARISFPIGPC